MLEAYHRPLSYSDIRSDVHFADVQVRLGEKEALDSLLGYFEGRATDLRALEYYQERRLKRLGLLDEEGKTTYDSFFKDGIA